MHCLAQGVPRPLVIRLRPEEGKEGIAAVKTTRRSERKISQQRHALGLNQRRPKLSGVRSPDAPALRFFRSSQLTVLNTQLRPLPATNATAWGHVQLKIYAIPVDPCGDVKNPQNDDIVNGAGLYFLPSFPSDVDAILVAGMAVGIPVDPCRNYSFRGGTQISLALADAIIASPPNYQISFGALGGRFALPEGSPDPPPIVPAGAPCNATITGPTIF